MKWKWYWNYSPDMKVRIPVAICSVCERAETGHERLVNDDDPNSGYRPICLNCSAERTKRQESRGSVSSGGVLSAPPHNRTDNPPSDRDANREQGYPRSTDYTRSASDEAARSGETDYHRDTQHDAGDSETNE